jgi:hypothetical protein
MKLTPRDKIDFILTIVAIGLVAYLWWRLVYG